MSIRSIRSVRTPISSLGTRLCKRYVLKPGITQIYKGFDNNKTGEYKTTKEEAKIKKTDLMRRKL